MDTMNTNIVSTGDTNAKREDGEGGEGPEKVQILKSQFPMVRRYISALRN